ncbi:MAG TPA: CdaR family protein [Anaerolineales bacterium]
MLAPLRWLVSNLSTFLLAFALAVVVWISSVTETDPNVERIRTVPLEIVGLDPNMLLVGNIPAQVRVTLRAPRTVSDRLASVDNAVQARVDVTGLEPGTYELEVQVHVNPSFQPVRRVLISPDRVTLTLEPLVSETFPVNLEVTGNPSLGYQVGEAVRDPAFVTVSGPDSAVSLVEEVHGLLDITDATNTIRAEIPLQALDAQENPVSGVTISPNEVTVTQPITLQGGYRNIVVRVETTGQPESGYRLNNVLVSPPNVVVYSSDPQLVNELPSFVETELIDLTGAEDDLESFVDLNLPEGISVVGDQRVLVQINIAAIEGSVQLSIPVTPIGLLPTRAAEISPETVDVILSGPIPILNRMTSSDIRVVVDLKDLDLGVYPLEPEVDVLPERVQVETILPTTVEVTVIVAPTATPTGAVTPTSRATPTATVQP